ncbi:MAG: response regulator [Eubacteriales bacterium]|nr:response regulator [Eubacteriales bacterium]
MQKMILADDEPVITRGIRRLVDWERLGICIVGEYADGNSAMDGILSMQPALALLDISMPGMDGIAILKNIRELKLSTRVIFISGFQDFTYARSAISYGAVEYLLKPVIREQLLAAVEKALGSLCAGTEGYESVGAMADTAAAKSSVTEPSAAEPSAAALEQTTYLPVLAELLFDGTEGKQEQKLLRFSMISYLEEYLAEKKLGILFSKNEHVVLVLKGLEEERAEEELTALLQEVEQAAGKKIGFAVGQAVESMGQIPQQYAKCLELSRYFFFAPWLPRPVLWVEQPVFWRTAGTKELSEARERLLEVLLSQDEAAFGGAWEGFVKILCLAAEGRREDACYYFCSTVRLAEERVAALGIQSREPDMGALLEQGRGCLNFRQMQELFGGIFSGYLELVRQTMISSEKKDLLRAREYIETHYQENLTLEVLAGQIHMNPYYFSSFFKKHAGENFKDYVNRVRLGHAVSLLLTTDLKTYEIAARVGFRDARSFTEVFSRAYQETPSAYKKRRLAEQRETIEKK